MPPQFATRNSAHEKARSPAESQDSAGLWVRTDGPSERLFEVRKLVGFHSGDAYDPPYSARLSFPTLHDPTGTRTGTTVLPSSSPRSTSSVPGTHAEGQVVLAGARSIRSPRERPRVRLGSRFIQLASERGAWPPSPSGVVCSVCASRTNGSEFRLRIQTA